MKDLKRSNLKKFKLLATSLFALMAIGYVATTLVLKSYNYTFLNYIKAFCEAGMVGALADWFAVTALFKKPLSLNIPHTNLIENSKDEIGENLGDFVRENFLNANNIKPYIKKFDVVSIFTHWIIQPKNRLNTINEISNLLLNIIDDLDDKSLKKFIYNKASHILNDFKISKPAFSLANYLVDKNEHNKLVDKILPYLRNYIVNNNKLVKEKVSEKGGFFGSIFSDKISKGMINGVADYIDEIIANPKHPVRLQLEIEILNLLNKLQSDDNFISKIENLKNSFFTSDQMDALINDAYLNLKSEILNQLKTPNSKVNNYISQYFDHFINELQTDLNLKNKINGWIKQFAFKLIIKNATYVSTLISSTVKNWDGKELSDKLELEVGKDLQFIRINGTLIGGIIGVFIHFITSVFLK